MMSVLLLGFAPDGRQAAESGKVVRSLATLVPAAVDGIVRDVCVAGPSDAALAEVADHAGCSFVAVRGPAEAFAAGARSLRSAHVLVTPAGTLVDRTVIDEIARLLPSLDPASRTAWFFRADSGAALHRLVPALAPVAGLICSRSWLERQTVGTFAALARHAGSRRSLKAKALQAQ